MKKKKCSSEHIFTLEMWNVRLEELRRTSNGGIIDVLSSNSVNTCAFMSFWSY